MKHLERILSIAYAVMLASVLFSCEEPIEEEKEPPVYKEEIHEEYVDGTICISNDYVSIDWDNKSNKVLTADTLTGDFTVQLADKNQGKELKAGSLVTMDVDSAIYLRRVTEVSQKGNTVSIKTEQGSIAELFAGSEFVLAIGEVPDTAVFVNSKGQHMRPIRTTYRRIVNDDGNFDDVPINLLSPTRTYYQDKNSWTVGPDIEIPDVSIYDKPPMSLEVGGRVKFQYTVGYAITCNFSGLGEFASEAASKDAYMRITVYWKPDIAQQVHFKGTAGLTIKGKSKKGADGKVISNGKTYFKNMGNEDVNKALAKLFEKDGTKASEIEDIWEIDLNKGAPNGEKEKMKMPASMKGMFEPKFEIYAGAALVGGVNFSLAKTITPSVITFEVSQNGNLMPSIKVPTIEIKKEKMSLEPYISIGGRSTLTMGARVGFIFSLFDHSFISVGIEGVLIDGETQGGFLGTLVNSDTEYGSYTIPTGAIVASQRFSTPSISIFAGINPSIFAKLPFYGDELKEWIEEHGQFNPGNLLPSYSFESPTDIRFKTKSNELKARAENQVIIQVLAEENGETVGCTSMATHVIVIAHGGGQFKYYNKNILGVEDGTYDWHVAHCITVNNYESVWWQPKTVDDCLEIRLYKYDGTYISKFLYLTEEGIGHDAVDMGGDVLWGTENVTLGNKVLFGWGDGTGQHIEQCYLEYRSYDEDGEPIGNPDPNYVEDEYKVFDYYCGTANYSEIGGSSSDFAANSWGGGWRLPKKKEWEWLIKNCKWEWSDNPKGYWVKSKVTNGAIFLPADGAKIGDIYDTTHTCEYWSSNGEGTYTIYNNHNIYPQAYYMSAYPDRKDDNKAQIGYTYKFYQQSIRPVKDK